MDTVADKASKTLITNSDTEVVADVIRQHSPDQPILAAFFLPGDDCTCPSHDPDARLIVIADIKGGIIQRHKVFGNLLHEVQEKGIRCWMSVYNPAEIENSTILSHYPNLVS